MQSGFATGTVRGQRTLSTFRITKYPVTWTNFDACVRAGACAQADGQACRVTTYAPHSLYTQPSYDQKTPSAPAMCVGEAQAEAYCRWVGGALPTLDQWLLAARGPELRRFPWGDAPTSCDQHPMAPQLLKRFAAVANADPAAPPVPDCAPTAFDGSELAVGTHPTGASPSGMEDALLVPGELLTSDPSCLFNACGQDVPHSVVFGLDPGAIDSVEPFLSIPNSVGTTASRSTIDHAYAFRCVFDAKRDDAP